MTTTAPPITPRRHHLLSWRVKVEGTNRISVGDRDQRLDPTSGSGHGSSSAILGLDIGHRVRIASRRLRLYPILIMREPSKGCDPGSGKCRRESNPRARAANAEETADVETSAAPGAAPNAANAPVNPDLRRLNDAWPDLLPAIRRAILAMFEASASGED